MKARESGKVTAWEEMSRRSQMKPKEELQSRHHRGWRDTTTNFLSFSLSLSQVQPHISFFHFLLSRAILSVSHSLCASSFSFWSFSCLLSTPFGTQVYHWCVHFEKKHVRANVRKYQRVPLGTLIWDAFLDLSSKPLQNIERLLRQACIIHVKQEVVEVQSVGGYSAS